MLSLCYTYYMIQRRKEKFDTNPLQPKGCKICSTVFLSDFSASKYCINCNPHLTTLRKKVLLTESQLMDLLDLQWSMIMANTLEAEKAEQEEIAAEKLYYEELRKKVWNKYSKAVIGETSPTTATGVHVG